MDKFLTTNEHFNITPFLTEIEKQLGATVETAA